MSATVSRYLGGSALVVLVAAVLLNMCQNTPSEEGAEARFAPMDAGSAVHVAEASSQLGPEGGTLTLTEGPARGATLLVPAGALTMPVTLTMRVGEAPIPGPSGMVAAGPQLTIDLFSRCDFSAAEMRPIVDPARWCRPPPPQNSQGYGSNSA